MFGLYRAVKIMEGLKVNNKMCDLLASKYCVVYEFSENKKYFILSETNLTTLSTEDHCLGDSTQ